MLTREWKVRLESVAIVLAGIQDCLEDKETDELKQLRKDCDQATSTNCWCYTYDAAKYLAPVIDRIINNRPPSLSCRKE